MPVDAPVGPEEEEEDNAPVPLFLPLVVLEVGPDPSADEALRGLAGVGGAFLPVAAFVGGRRDAGAAFDADFDARRAAPPDFLPEPSSPADGGASAAAGWVGADVRPVMPGFFRPFLSLAIASALAAACRCRCRWLATAMARSSPLLI